MYMYCSTKSTTRPVDMHIKRKDSGRGQPMRDAPYSFAQLALLS